MTVISLNSIYLNFFYYYYNFSPSSQFHNNCDEYSLAEYENARQLHTVSH